jgi:cytochrome c biogenesis protein CcmG/thiol:disulfide interchange protein DsbE
MTETDEVRPAPRRRLWAYVPVLVFAALVLAFFLALRSGDPSKLPSTLVGKPVPEFALPPLDGLKRRDGSPSPGLAAADLATGDVTLVNVWASWCGPCRAEHPLLMRLAGEDGVRVVGINQKDVPENARRFLGALGNPFDAVGTDFDGRASIEWGVYGVPETFVVDGTGTIRLKHVGPIDEGSLAAIIRPAIAAARSAGGE